MAAKRLTRKQLLKEPDEFITLTGRTIEWVKTHTKQVVTGVSIFITAVLLVVGYRCSEEQRARAASNLFSKALETYQQQVEEKDQAKVMEEIRPEFDKLVETYHSQAAGRLGQILYGHILLNADKG